MIGSIISGAAQATAQIAGDAYGAYRDNIADNQWSRDRNAAKEMNYDFAKNGIQWKVDDARAAGIHPLFALGSQTNTPSFSAGVSGFHSGVSSGFGLGAAGQNISRAISSSQDNSERENTEIFNASVRSLELERMRLQNKALENDVALGQANLSSQALRTQQAGPAFPSVNSHGQVIPGQANARQSSLIKVNPAVSTANHPSAPGTEAATIPDLGFARTNDGGLAPVPSDQVKNRIEDDFINETAWKIRNLLPATVDYAGSAPPSAWLPKGKVWSFSIPRGAWYPVDRRVADYSNFTPQY